MKNFYFVAVFATLALLCGCSKATEENKGVEVAKSELSIGLPIGISRTAVDAEGKASWVEGDTFALWAENTTGQLKLEGAEFQMMYYWHSYQSAVFTSQANALAEGDYTYYAVSPKPESTNGLKATYTIPAEQQGASFNGGYDIMVATPIEAEALSAEKVNNLALDFQHKMHTLKVTIAENNLGSEISKLKFSFPSEVTGKITVDASNPDATPVLENASRELTIDCGNGITNGNTVWAAITPQTISGDIKLFAIGSDGRISLEKNISLSKECLAGHITPLALTVPKIRPTLRFSIGTNNLGEAVENLSITDHNGTALALSKNGEYYDYSVNSTDASVFDQYKGQTFSATFESKSAIVKGQFTMPSSFADGINNIPALTVPYLFEEDFSCIHTSASKDGDNDLAGDDRNQNGASLDSYMSHSGWNAARFMLGAGTCPRINARYQQVKIIVSFASSHHGRLDSPAMTNLKSGANVNLAVQFDAGAAEYSKKLSGQKVAVVSVATHTNGTNPINGIPMGTKGLGSNFSTTLADYGITHHDQELSIDYGLDAFSSAFPTYSAYVTGVNNATRLCFYPHATFSVADIGNNEVAIYIDNIKVSIAQ